MATKSRMMSGGSILKGDNSTPGIKIHKEIARLLPQIEAACRKMGLDYYPIVVEPVSYDEMAEIASYGGFPVRYPHWRFGMEYEQLARGYEFNQYRISEMVINSNPCYIYYMDSNTLVANVDVISHAIGHNDFFKNNVFFEPTNENIMNKLANHGTRIREYMSRWGYERVTEFIDDVLKIRTLISPSSAWDRKTCKQLFTKDTREYRHPVRRISQNNYMDGWVNTPGFIQKQKVQIEKDEAADSLELFRGSERDIFRFIKDFAPLKPWQQDVITMLYEEELYFFPQGCTKMINEGWASFVDQYIMCREGLVSLGQESHDAGIWEYADHKAKVLGGKYSQNPYKTGWLLLSDIEDRWNKGKFGNEWDNCTDFRERDEWDKKLGLGLQKVFDVRKHYNDYMLVKEFFTQEFCDKYEYYEYQHFPNGNWEIVSKDHSVIKKKLLRKYLNRGLPDIRLEDPNHLGKGWLFLQHRADEGGSLYVKYVKETLPAMWKLWKNDVVLATKVDSTEYVYHCDGEDPEDDVHFMKRSEYEDTYF